MRAGESETAVCVHARGEVREWESERVSERESERERDREGERENLAARVRESANRPPCLASRAPHRAYLRV